MAAAKPIWAENGKVYIIDQTLLPAQNEVIEVKTVKDMWDCIKALQVRGAPAIGLAMGFGIYIGVKEEAFETGEEFVAAVKKVSAYLETSRPTAVNLFWASKRVNEKVAGYTFTTREAAIQFLLDEAMAMLAEDIATCRSIGRYGAEVFRKNHIKSVLTHCNAGAIATSEYGTALAPVYVLAEEGEPIKVYSDETRPLLQGSRLTAYELLANGIDVTTICDNMAGVVMRNGWVDAVIVGADRIASNGDTANKIGTYTVSILAREHHIPVYIAAPFSTIDLEIEDGSQIPIEERNPDEVRYIQGVQTAPKDVKVFNPAFDVTPHELIAGIITEKGVIYPPFKENMQKVLKEGKLI